MLRKNAVIDLGTYRTEDLAVTEEGEDWTQFLPAGTELLLGQYRITGYLNCGGFGITYLARDSLGRTVVVKECFPSAMCFRSGRAMAIRSSRYKDELSSIVRHFVGEAHRLANVRHDNIVHVHQIFEENDTAYIAMDFVDGPDLLDIIEDDPKRLSPMEIVALTQKMLEAVKYLHARGLLHRDISPDNILIGQDGEPVLIDFGAAREHAKQSRRTLSKLKFVKDGYSPQEFYIAGSEQGAWSDLYSLAASIYHLITGEAPVDAQTRIAALATRKPDPYVPLTGNVTDYPSRFLRALDKALEVLPQHRLQTAGEWLDMISGGVGRDLIRSRPVTAAVDLYAQIPTGGSVWRFVAEKPTYVAAAVVAGVAITGLSVWALLGGKSEVLAAGEPPSIALAQSPGAGAREFADTPSPSLVTAALIAPEIAPLPRLPGIATTPTRTVLPDALPTANPPVAGPAQARAPAAPSAPGIDLAARVPSYHEAAPRLSRPDVLAVAAPQTVAFRPPEHMERPDIQVSFAAPARAPKPGLAAATPPFLDVPPQFPLRLAALPSIAADRLATRSAPPSARVSGVAANPVAWSQWDIRMPFGEDPVRADGRNVIRIAAVDPRANLAVSGDWIASDIVVDAVNGVQLMPDMSLADHFLSALAADVDGYMRATVRFRDPATGRTGRGVLAVPVVRETLLADGTVLVTGKEDQSWVTRVETAAPGTDLREGDIMLGEVFTSIAFSSHEDIARALSALSRNGVERAEFTLLREGKRQMVGWTLAPE